VCVRLSASIISCCSRMCRASDRIARSSLCGARIIWYGWRAGRPTRHAPPTPPPPRARLLSCYPPCALACRAGRKALTTRPHKTNKQTECEVRTTHRHAEAPLILAHVPKEVLVGVQRHYGDAAAEADHAWLVSRAVAGPRGQNPAPPSSAGDHRAALRTNARSCESEAKAAGKKIESSAARVTTRPGAR
jgi:hypothetical protein